MSDQDQTLTDLPAIEGPTALVSYCGEEYRMHPRNGFRVKYQ